MTPTSTTASIAVTRPGLPGRRLQALRTRAQVVTWPTVDGPGPDHLVTHCEGADAVVCVNGDRFDAAVLARLASTVRIIAVASAGYDSVDVDFARSLGIVVSNTPGVLAEATADLAFGLIIAARRRIVEADRYVRAGLWERNSVDLLLGQDIYGATLGIVGFGQIGRAVARRATGFGMTVLYHHPTRKVNVDGSSWAQLDDLLEQSDIVSVHVPLTPQSRGLIGEEAFRRMKSTATFVNTSRGAVVDETALVKALREGWIASAGIDVYVVEPNPDRTSPLFQLEQCVTLPHIGSATIQARTAMVDLAVRNVEAFLDGRPAPSLVR